MILLIFSDNHRDRNVVERMIKQQPKVDRIISLGDSEMTEAELSSMGVFGVRGNYPFEPKFPYDLQFRFGEIDVFFTHGHKYNVKSGLSTLYHHAKNLGCVVACYGHTHACRIDDYGDMVLLNPGSLTFPKAMGYKTYCLLKLYKNQIDIEIIDVETGNIVDQSHKYLDLR